MLKVPLPSTAQEIIDQCPRFRILLVGKSGAGKSSLVNKTFGINLATVSHFHAGISDINREITSESNPYFVLHDSQGFEPGEHENMKIVKSFIDARSKRPRLQDRLHAIWHVIETPVAGARVLEVGDHSFLNNLGDLPVISVFTKYDLLLWSFAFQFNDDDSIMNKADKAFRDQCLGPLKTAIKQRNHAYARVSIESDETVSVLADITRCLLSGDLEQANALSFRTIPIKLISSPPSSPTSPIITTTPDAPLSGSSRQRRRSRLSLSHLKFWNPPSQSETNPSQNAPSTHPVSPSSPSSIIPSQPGPVSALSPDATPSENLAEPVTLAWAVAQRMNPQINLDASIAVGRKKYWSTLAASAHFPGHTLSKCLDTLIKDVVIVWNFEDPQKILTSNKFKGMLSKLVEDLADPEEFQSDSNTIATGFQGMVGAAGAVVAAVGLPEPIGIPIAAGFALATWLWQVYKRTPGVLRCLIASIVDLTIVMQRLFWLMRARGGTGPITPKLITFAIQSFSRATINPPSEATATRVHNEIRSYVDKTYFVMHLNRGYALNEIVRLIKSPAFNPSPNYEEWAKEAVRNITEETSEEQQVWR